MNFISYKELIQDTEALCEVNPQWRNLAGVVGIPRSGMLPAAQIAMRYNLPLADLQSFLNTNGRFYPSRGSRQYGNRSQANGILVVDDSSWSGESLRAALQELAIHPLLKQLEVNCVAIYGNPDSNEFPSHKNPASPRIFEWNWSRNAYLCDTMLDLDGIICEDPDLYLTRDKSYYENWIVNPKPRHLPTQEVRAIVSSRLEIYRPQTENWLRMYGVRYQELALLDCTEQERHEKNLHAEHKVQIYSNSVSPLFIESDRRQAIYIYKRTGKSVLCPATFSNPAFFLRSK